MDLAAAAAGIRVTRMSLPRDGWSIWRTSAGATRATRTERLRFHRERANASVRRTGLGATTCVSRRGTCRVFLALTQPLIVLCEADS